ncbi:response regulator transcription factor [Albidovulum sp.]
MSEPAGTEARELASALIVEDHPLFSEALSMTLRAFLGVERIETADRVETAIARLTADPRPDIVVLDLNLPDVSGMEGLIRIARVARAVPILVVSSMAESRVIGAALKAGAAGFVPKHSPRETFRAAFAAIREGRVFVPDGYQPGQVAEDDAIERLRLLTPQQARILQLICEGRLNKQIAHDLSIAETTVKAHVTAIMRKLGVFSRTQAVLMAKGADFATLLSGRDGGA